MAKVDTKVLASLKRRSKGAHKRIKDEEAKVRGRELPPGLQDVVGCITGIQIKETDAGDPNIHIRSIVVEDSYGSGETDYQGTYQGWNYWFGETEFQTFEDVQTQLYSDLKLLGFEDEIRQAKDIDDVIKFVADELTIEQRSGESESEAALKRGKIFYSFNVGRNPNKKGEYKRFMEGRLENQDYKPPKKQAKNEHPQEYEEYEEDQEEQEETESESTEDLIGSSVNAPWDDGEMYPATILEVNGEQVQVEYEDGTEEWVNLEDCIFNE